MSSATVVGFDAFVGNPPFLGGKRISTNLGEAYKDWLAISHEDSTSNADLVAHFFRRAFDLLRSRGAFGLIATNTISQGDTRYSGLRWICSHGGVIYNATKRYKWPGIAAVVASIVHVKRGHEANTSPCLDGKRVESISAFLVQRGGDDDPVPLAANAACAFSGCDIKGLGFTFDDATPSATAVSEMTRLIAKDRRNEERIFPYVGGEELNTSAGQIGQRWVISFGNMSKEEAQSWPDLLAIVESRVRPERLTKSAELRRWPWWQFWRARRELAAAIAPLKRMLARSSISQHFAFAWLPVRTICSHNVTVFASDSDSFFCCVQSRAHEAFATFFSSSLEDRMGYRPSDCFEPFPFPAAWESTLALGDAGRSYEHFRAALMAKNDEGLTATYNRFHDPDEHAPDILELRSLHDAMDRAVLDAYGWTDLRPTCAFLLDYGESDPQEEEIGGGRRKRLPWRYRWPDDVRDEVLARLLGLNIERAEAERRLGAEASLSRQAQTTSARKLARETGGQSGELF